MFYAIFNKISYFDVNDKKIIERNKLKNKIIIDCESFNIITRFDASNKKIIDCEIEKIVKKFETTNFDFFV